MNRLIAIGVLACTVFSCTPPSQSPLQTSRDYPITPVAFTDVTLNDSFWRPRIETNASVTIPFAFEQSETTGRMKNFDMAAGVVDGEFCTRYPFDDSDVYKVLEGASYSLLVQPNPDLEAYTDSVIARIAAAQEPDGYLYTNRTINPDSTHEMSGPERWLSVGEHSHELYNLGHLYEAAVAHFQATKKRSLLDIAIKSADLVDEIFGPGKLELYPGHQEVEIGLVKLYRATGDARYLDLARFFLDVRGPDGDEYNQAHARVVDQKEAVGHAVRAGYMFAGMADVAALTGDQGYIDAIDAIWDDVVQGKLYVTGGVGSTGSNEGFGEKYDLPNMSAYNETCASIANILWNQRLFLSRGEAKYIDVLERTLYNALLSGIAYSGDKFFYPNPLESNGQHERSPWFACACCPSNVSRFIPSIPGYIYAHTSDAIFVNLYASSETRVELSTGTVSINQESNYPWDGAVRISVGPESEMDFELKLRIPGWAQNEPVPGGLYRFEGQTVAGVTLSVNGTPEELVIKDGYALVSRKWKAGDTVELTLPMSVRKIRARDEVVQDVGRFALQRGPLVYTVEGKDQTDVRVRHLVVPADASFETTFDSLLFGGVNVIDFDASLAGWNLEGETERVTDSFKVTAIPYHAWANRGPGQMLVWLPDDINKATPLPAETIAFRSTASSSGDLKTVTALADQYQPLAADDHANAFLHWWPTKGTTEWVQYDFEKAETVGSVKVYWFDDDPYGECRIPKSWRLFYRANGEWKRVNTTTAYSVTKGAYDTVRFEPVRTSALRLEVDLPDGFSAGIHEWVVEPAVVL